MFCLKDSKNLIIPVVCDLSDWKKTKEVIENILPEEGIQYVVNNAGMYLGIEKFGCISEENFDKYAEICYVSLLVTLYFIQTKAKDL